MNPGHACNVCHQLVNGQGDSALIFVFAGSVFPTAHEPDDCLAPTTAGVLFQGRVRVMATPTAEGDCNTCHSQSGNTDAPGRILLPRRTSRAPRSVWPSALREPGAEVEPLRVGEPQARAVSSQRVAQRLLLACARLDGHVAGAAP